MDYCLKLQEQMKKLKMSRQEKIHFLEKRYRYVSTVCEPDSKQNFFASCGVKIAAEEKDE